MSDSDEWVTGSVTVAIGGVPLTMQMTIPAKPVKPRRMLPVFQMMAGAFTNLGVEKAAAEGKTVSCKAGCGACCSQAVPLAEIEAFEIAAMVEAMPEPRRTTIRERFEKAVAHFASIGWFERLQNSAAEDAETRSKVVLDYFFERVPCPFLEDESCSIHADRPLVCREYLVTSPAENCAKMEPKTVEGVELPAHPSRTLRRLGQTADRGAVDFIPLVLALKWAENNADSFVAKTGEEWMAEFFEKLTRSEIPGRGNAPAKS